MKKDSEHTPRLHKHCTKAKRKANTGQPETKLEKKNQKHVFAIYLLCK